MRIPVPFHPQLRSALSRPLRRELCSSLVFVRPKTTHDAPPFKVELPSYFKTGSSGSRLPATHAKTSPRRGPPESILIYHGGSGRTLFLGMLRLTSLFVFGVSTLIVTPAFMGPDFPLLAGPAIFVAGAFPMLFISYTAAPFVNFVHLALPIAARRSRAHAIEYAKNLPPTATLYINTLKFNTIPRVAVVQLGALVPHRAVVRPVSFWNSKPAPLPWWRPRTLRQFYTAEKSKPGKETAAFYPELWEHVYKQIQNNRPMMKTK
ncbi:hypothetical protein BDW59DRAFT_126579 [Aspergillus cavernicola]|uniref:Uncharacterized protein n=1 Tax=Aspergillus cavernicola TaxID=176166 RepID=A0ABR4HTG9_9EURO